MAITNGILANGDGKHEQTSGDEGVTASPYTSQAVQVHIGPNGANYTILQAMVDLYPALQARINQKKPGSPIELPEVDEDIAHTLIHFIYTQNYQSLGLGGIPENVRAVAEFKRGILAYCAAQLCSIEALREVTESKMEHFSKQISLFELHGIVAQTSDKLPRNDIWFPDHLYKWIKTMLQENDELVGDERLLALIGKSTLFDRAIVRSVAEMYNEKAAALKVISHRAVDDDDTESIHAVNGIKDGSECHDVESTGSNQFVAEVTVSDETKTTGQAPTSGDQAGTGPTEVKRESETDPMESVVEDLSVKPANSKPEHAEQPVETRMENNDESIDGVVNGKDDELAKLESASKATDSDVEAARAKASSKKSKKKNKKKGAGGAEVPSVA